MRVFVIGREGQVARSLREAGSQSWIKLEFGSRPDVDLLRPESVASAIKAYKPDVVINPAAYTAVDKAEAEPEVAFAVNQHGARAVAAAAHELDIPIIHLSTDYVFDGKKGSAYLEADPVNPQGVYGRSKLKGEEAVATVNPRHVILRTSWVYAPFGHNFVRTMLRIGAERDRVRVVNDQMGCPTYAPDLARAILEIAQKLAEWRHDFVGITHVAGPDAMTWHEFACDIFEGSKQRGGPFPLVDPIPTSAYPTAAVRPANSQLSTVRLKDVFGINLPTISTSLARCLDRLLEERGK